MNTFSAILSILVINGAAQLCLIRITDADEMMGKRILRGRVDEGSRPYFVLIETYVESQENLTACGGVLIETDIVLSAARCFHPYEKLTKVIVKVENFAQTDESTRGRKEEFEAVSVEVYNEMIHYEEKQDSKRPPDIARLKLASAVVDEKDVLHSCGPSFWNEEDKKRKQETKFKEKVLLTVGMGVINLDGDKPNVLQSLTIMVTDEHLKCNATTSSRLFDNMDRFCAVGAIEYYKNFLGGGDEVPNEVASGACDGDEGGPVIDALSDTPPCLVGVLNEGIQDRKYGLNPCESGVLFTSVENLENWVKNKHFTEIFQKKLSPSPDVGPVHHKSKKKSSGFAEPLKKLLPKRHKGTTIVSESKKPSWGFAEPLKKLLPKRHKGTTKVPK